MSNTCVLCAVSCYYDCKFCREPHCNHGKMQSTSWDLSESCRFPRNGVDCQQQDVSKNVAPNSRERDSLKIVFVDYVVLLERIDISPHYCFPVFLNKRFLYTGYGKLEDCEWLLKSAHIYVIQYGLNKLTPAGNHQSIGSGCALLSTCR